MMRWIVGTSLQFRFLVVGLAAMLMVFGVTRLRDMPVDVFPEFLAADGGDPNRGARALRLRGGKPGHSFD